MRSGQKQQGPVSAAIHAMRNEAADDLVGIGSLAVDASNSVTALLQAAAAGDLVRALEEGAAAVSELATLTSLVETINRRLVAA